MERAREPSAKKAIATTVPAVVRTPQQLPQRSFAQDRWASQQKQSIALEALMLSLIGGITGILIGFIVGFALTHGLGFPFVVSPIAVALAFGVSAIVGVVFGFYPAVHAAALDPIQALHSE